jgi:hypothetical protein
VTTKVRPRPTDANDAVLGRPRDRLFDALVVLTSKLQSSIVGTEEYAVELQHSPAGGIDETRYDAP